MYLSTSTNVLEPMSGTLTVDSPAKCSSRLVADLSLFVLGLTQVLRFLIWTTLTVVSTSIAIFFFHLGVLVALALMHCHLAHLENVQLLHSHFVSVPALSLHPCLLLPWLVLTP